MKSLALVLYCLFLTGILNAQSATVDAVLLKSGERLYGTLIYYEQENQVSIRLLDSTTVTVEDKMVDQVVQGVSYDEVIEDLEIGNANMSRNTGDLQGFYSSLFVPFALGGGTEGGISLGTGINGVLGYQIRPGIGLGAGTGVDYYARRGETIYPVFAELRFNLINRSENSSYYVSTTGGYGFARANESLGIIAASGGYLFYPSFGYRALTRQDVDVNLELGVRFQQASFTRTLFNGDVEVRDITYQRFVLRIGLTFWSARRK